jgi:hypothetical protein
MRASTTMRFAVTTLTAALLAGGALTATAGGTLTAAAAAAGTGTVNVTVNADEGQGSIPATGYGLNSAVWDSQMNVPQVQGLLQQAGVRMLRYPGGSYGDIYHWQTNTAPGGYVAPGTDFDSFMGTVRKIGAQPILIANYGMGTPAEAAAWVQYANVTKGYGAKYWEIGNEIYGNGYYGADWESDNHASKSPAAYAQNVVDYANAMKAVDPTIKIGAVLTLPGNWPDGVVGSGDSGDWNKIVLSAAGSSIDFVIVHWYPGSSGAADVLNAPEQLSGELAQLRQEISQYAGRSGIQIALTEENSNVSEDTQPAALFAADTYLTALEHGVFTVDWWDTHNGPTAISTAPDGATDYGDYRILSSGTCVGSTCEPPLNTPFPPYYAISMLSKLGAPGDTMVRAGSDSLETIVLTPQPGSQSALTAPGSPSVSNVTDTQATVSWTPSAGGQVTRYGVYRQFGTDSELLGSSTSGTFTVTNLTPGTSYTLNVLATDQKGYLSPPSAPVTFTTGSPAHSTCAVTYAVTQGWSSGFVVNIGITDTGPDPVSGWTLAFTFPASTESVSSSNWNANWSESGASVVATNVSWDGYLAPNSGNSVSIGFVANQSGAYPSPASVTLNGTVCSTTYSS